MAWSVSAQTNQWLADLGGNLANGVVPVAIGGALGYLFAVRRDSKKAQSERKARYDDEILNASTQLLADARKNAITLRKARQKVDEIRTQRKFAEISTERQRELQKSKSELDELNLKLATIYSAIQASKLKLNVLAPILDESIEELLASSRGEFDPEALRTTTEALVVKVRLHLKVQHPKK